LLVFSSNVDANVDGDCDYSNDNEACDYDGGDCLVLNKYPDCEGNNETLAGEYRLFLYSKIMDEIILVFN
jgi:hypothetical protein